MNLLIERIRNFFRKKFNVLKARTAVAGIKGLIHAYKKQSVRFNDEIFKLQNAKLDSDAMVEKYELMLGDLRQELKE